MSYIEYEDDQGRKVRVGFTGNWMPQCSIHAGDNWCGHIEDFVTEGDDASLFWDMTQAIDLAGVFVPVPIIPSADQWVEVKFGAFNTTVRSYPIELYFEAMDTNVEGQFLGFIGLGEGRLVMRQMVWQWFQGLMASYPDGKVPTCIKKSHGYKQEMAWQQAMKDNKRRNEEFFCVINKGACSACVKIAEAAKDLDDLVPF